MVILFSHIISSSCRKVSTVQQDILREITFTNFITICCYNCSSLLLGIAAFFFILLYVICKLNYHRFIGVGKEGRMHRVQYCPWCQASSGSLGVYLLQIRGDHCSLFSLTFGCAGPLSPHTGFLWLRRVALPPQPQRPGFHCRGLSPQTTGSRARAAPAVAHRLSSCGPLA